MGKQANAQSNLQRILLLEKSFKDLCRDVQGLSTDVKQVNEELCTRFDRLDVTVQDLRIQNAKLQEQFSSRLIIDKSIEKQLNETRKFSSRIFFALLGGGVSFVVIVIQTLLS
ncbi:MAG TPA: hypothetical protein VNU93_07820 [Verrucomicrobiae bacterium]|nr:hypothetical protein [Verrucomicrobiae bacterium]